MSLAIMSLSVLLFSVNALSAMPPLESLFRNPGNREVTEETSVLNLRVKELVTTQSLDETRLSRENYFDGYYKFVFHQGKNKRLSLFQIGYKGSKIKNSFIQELREINFFPQFLSRKGRPSQDVFWGLIVGLVLNRSDLISSFLEKTNRDYQPNREVLNGQVKNLYGDYKKYLQTIKDEPSLKDSLISPLRPNNEKAANKVKKILSMPFYWPSKKISLIKEGDNFYIVAKLEKITAKFNNQNLNLTEFRHTDPSGEILFQTFDYGLVNGVDKMPKNIIFHSFGKVYHINIISLRRASYSEKSLEKIKKGWKESYKENKEQEVKKSVVTTYRPKFLL